MSKEKYTGPVIHLYLSIGYASANQSRWVKAPDDWSDMNESERQAFVDEMAAEFAQEYIEYSGSIYDSPDDAREATRNNWDMRYSDDALEDY